MWRAIAAVCIGGTAGCLLRWVLAVWLKDISPVMPLGTLAANLIGGYIVGVAVAFFALNSSIAPEWRLLVITGFCGGLTTFSSFSAEVVLMLRQDRWLWACSTIALHLFGSLLMTFAGIATVAGIKHSAS
ncbi:MAG TPA: fluoride efflux transporter CrcB [Steroidobacteraceae bacterium]|nr:fluoride efflux transporter CrcB [Steroidobacteraceae bacterium]